MSGDLDLLSIKTLCSSGMVSIDLPTLSTTWGGGTLIGDRLLPTADYDIMIFSSFYALISFTLALRSSWYLRASLAWTNELSSVVRAAFYPVTTLMWLLREATWLCKLELPSMEQALELLQASSSPLIAPTLLSAALILTEISWICWDKWQLLDP